MHVEIPIEAGTFRFTPPSLKDIEGAPAFVLRYGTRRDKHAYRAELAARGLVSYGEEEIRAALIEEMQRLSGNTEEAKGQMADAAREYWAAGKSLEMEIKAWREDCAELLLADEKAELPPAPVLDFDAEREAWITGVMQSVRAKSTVLANMAKANARRDFIVSEVALALILVSVEGFDLARDAEGVIEPSCLTRLEDWLGDKAEELGIDSMKSDEPYSELRDAALLAFHLPKEAEKNFASPPQPTSDPNGSPEAAAAGSSTSPASDPSTETPSTDTNTSGKSATSPRPAKTDGQESPTLTDAP